MNFDAIEKRYGLPAGMLAAVQRVESGGNPKAVSPKGAQGLFQIMPATAKELGINPLDPVQAADGAARYLSQNLKRFGTPELALAAYNAGPGAVQKYGGIPPYKETQGYVSKVQANMKNPFDQFDEPEANPFDQFDEVQRTPSGATGKWKETRADKAAKNRKDLAALGKGAISGLADVGDTILNVATYLPGKAIPAIADWNRERNAGLESFNAENEVNPNFKAGRVTSNVVSTLPVGGVVAKGASKVPLLKSLAPAIRSGGLSGGNIGQKVAGGAITGAAAAGLIDPEYAGTGAAFGAAVPMVAGAGRYIGNSAKSLVQPFTSKGQQKIVSNIIEKFAQGGPTQVDLRAIVPGSAPTLSQATGNAGLARLENLIRDTNPNAFQAHAATNAAARSDALSRIAGDESSIAALEALRNQRAVPVLNQSLKNAKSADATAPILIDKILSGPRGKRTAVQESLGRIKSQLYNADGTPVTDAAQLYHSAYKEIGDLLDKGAHLANPGAKQATRELMAVKRALARDINRAAPGFKNYLQTYAEGSKPINSQKFMQSLNLTDASGTIQLGRVQSAIRNIEKLRKARGANPAKDIDDASLQSLYSIRDDLLRANKQNLGKAAGSNTRQNFALENILDNALPGPLKPLQGPLGRFTMIPKVIYGGADEEIKRRLVDALLDPAGSGLVNNGNLGLLGQSAPQPLLGRFLPNNLIPVSGSVMLEPPY